MIRSKRTATEAGTAEDATAVAEPETLSAPPAGGGQVPDAAEIPAAVTPLTGDAVTLAEIAAAAERFTAAAAALRDRAGRSRAEAERIRAEARAEADRIMAIAETTAAPLARSAADDDAQAPPLAEFGRVLSHHAGPEGTASKAERADARLAELRAERERLESQVADLGRDLAGLAAERQEADSRRVAARDSGDRHEMAAQIALATAIDESSRHVASDLDGVRARLAEIGDGEILPVWPQKLLYDAITQASHIHRAIEDSLNWIWPDRPEAIAARERQLRRDAGDFAAQQRADAAARQRDRAHRTVVIR